MIPDTAACNVGTPVSLQQPLALLVDHDEDTLELYTGYFELEQWRTERATDGASALVMVVERHPDLIVTETWLPVLDGIRLTEIIKADPSTQHVPIVALTADAREEELARARGAGCERVLTKPCLPAALVRTARELLAATAALRARAAATVSAAEATLAHAVDIQDRAEKVRRKHRMASVRTVDPAAPPPPLHCPTCGSRLAYDCSYVGGVSLLREQWDYLNCQKCCRRFQYRQRTKRLRVV